MKTNKVLDRAAILDCSEPAKLKVIDLIDVLAKFPELFSAAPFEPECKKPFDLDPNDSLLAAPVYSRRQSESYNHAPSFFSKPKIVIPKAPFSNSALIGDPAFRGWFYIDEGDVLQGPFTSLEMDNWFDQGYLFNELLVKYNEENVFHRLIDLFGKPEYPPPRKIERRVSTQDEALPVLEFFKSVSTTDNFPNPFKGRLHKSMNRISLDEHNNPEIKQIMNNLAGRKEENSAPTTENHAEVKKVEKAEEVKPAETKPEEKVVEKETKTEVVKQEKVEETKEAQKSPEDEQAKKAGKNGARKHHRKNGKKSHSQVEEQVVQYQPKVEQPEAKPEKKVNKSKKTAEKEEPVAQKTEVAASEEHKPVKKSKKTQKAEDEKEKPVEKVPRRHSHAYDRRDKVKYYTVFEPKVDSTELKDKAQEPVMIGDQSK